MNIIPPPYEPTLPVEEDFGELLDDEKNAFYYFSVLFLIISTVVSTLLTGAFLVISILVWGTLKPNKFFWLLSQLTISVFLISTLNLLVNVPASLSLISVTRSEIFHVIAYTIDFFHYSIIFSNLFIAIQRLAVFFLRHLTDKLFETPIIYIWMLLIWLLPFLIEYLYSSSNCNYRYSFALKTFQLNCKLTSQPIFSVPSAGIEIIDTILQFVLPILIFGAYIALVVKISTMRRDSMNKKEVDILKQAIFVFVVFQASSCVFLFARIFKISNVTAFIVKRFVNTMEILGGTATPCFFFFTSKEIRKLVSTRVTAVSSQGSSNVQVRRRTACDGDFCVIKREIDSVIEYTQSCVKGVTLSSGPSCYLDSYDTLHCYCKTDFCNSQNLFYSNFTVLPIIECKRVVNKEYKAAACNKCMWQIYYIKYDESLNPITTEETVTCGDSSESGIVVFDLTKQIYDRICPNFFDEACYNCSMHPEYYMVYCRCKTPNCNNPEGPLPYPIPPNTVTCYVSGYDAEMNHAKYTTPDMMYWETYKQLVSNESYYDEGIQCRGHYCFIVPDIWESDTKYYKGCISLNEQGEHRIQLGYSYLNDVPYYICNWDYCNLNIETSLESRNETIPDNFSMSFKLSVFIFLIFYIKL